MVRIANHREPPIVDLLLGRDVPALRRLLMLAYRPGFFAMLIILLINLCRCRRQADRELRETHRVNAN